VSKKMSAPARRLIAPFLLAASLAHPAIGQVPGGGRDVVGTARDLYASARYDEALAVLNDSSTAVTDRKSIEQYRSLCLLALGRGSEAESAIAAVVTADPSYIPNETDASPRVRSAFSDVRRRLLPEIANKRYSEARASFDRKDHGAAVQQFKQVIALLDDPDMGGRLADLRTLSNGFLDLSVAALTPPPAASKPVSSTPPPAPEVPQSEPNRIYTMADKDVTPPVIVRQAMPRLTPSMKSQAKERGIIEVVIDEQGRVTFAAVRASVHPMFDTELISNAREWKYQPATFMGRAVKYRKMIQINVTRGSSN
jgi:hypothetical protein